LSESKEDLGGFNKRENKSTLTLLYKRRELLFLLVKGHTERFPALRAQGVGNF
jgi:hypothetical protein